MPRSLPDFRRRSSLWLAVSALLALTPKCLLCVLAYAGIGAALGLGGPEMCGAPAGSTGSWASALALSGITLGVVGFLGRAFKHVTCPIFIPNAVKLPCWRRDLPVAFGQRPGGRCSNSKRQMRSESTPECSEF
jgi:hypothetical protein